MKENIKAPVDQENFTTVGEQTPTHLAFRRIVVHDFTGTQVSQPLRYHYRGHSKHLLQPRRAA